jgi:hypothetical protein
MVVFNFQIKPIIDCAVVVNTSVGRTIHQISHGLKGIREEHRISDLPIRLDLDPFVHPASPQASMNPLTCLSRQKGARFILPFCRLNLSVDERRAIKGRDGSTGSQQPIT